MDELTNIRSLIQQGNRVRAWRELNRILTFNPKNEEGWILAYELVSKRDKNRVLIKALEYIPFSQRLNKLHESLTSSLKSDTSDPIERESVQVASTQGRGQRLNTNKRFPAEARSSVASATQNGAIGCIAAVLILIALLFFVTGNDDAEVSVPQATEDLQDQKAITYVQNYKVPQVGTLNETIQLAKIIAEVDGNTFQVDGWTVRASSSSYLVRFYFYYNGSYEYAEWKYSPGSGLVTPQNDWGRTFLYLE